MKPIELITPIIILPLMTLDLFLVPVKWILNIKTESLADRWLDFEWEVRQNK